MIRKVEWYGKDSSDGTSLAIVDFNSANNARIFCLQQPIWILELARERNKVYCVYRTYQTGRFRQLVNNLGNSTTIERISYDTENPDAWKLPAYVYWGKPSNVSFGRLPVAQITY